MDIGCLVASAFFFASAAAVLRDALRLRGWSRVKANVVHWREAPPFGREVPRRIPQTFLVVRGDGVEETVTRTIRNPVLAYYAELVYFVDGAIYETLLSFDEPCGDSYELWVNPDDPKEHEAYCPGFSLPVLLSILGSTFLVLSIP